MRPRPAGPAACWVVLHRQVRGRRRKKQPPRFGMVHRPRPPWAESPARRGDVQATREQAERAVELSAGRGYADAEGRLLPFVHRGHAGRRSGSTTSLPRLPVVRVLLAVVRTPRRALIAGIDGHADRLRRSGRHECEVRVLTTELRTPDRWREWWRRLRRPVPESSPLPMQATAVCDGYGQLLLVVLFREWSVERALLFVKSGARLGILLPIRLAGTPSSGVGKISFQRAARAAMGRGTFPGGH